MSALRETLVHQPADALIRDTRERMLRAADRYELAIAELQGAMRALEAHPDYRRTMRRYRAGATSRDALTLVAWLHSCCQSALEDGAERAHEYLREDAREAQDSMRLCIETEDRERAARCTVQRRVA